MAGLGQKRVQNISKMMMMIDYYDDYGVVDDNDDCREVGLEEKQIEARYLLSDSGSHRI